MPITPDPPFPKTQGDNIRSKDWNDAVNEVIRLDTAKFDRAGGRITGPLRVDGSVGIGTTPENRSLTIQGNAETSLSVRALTGGPFAVALGANSFGGFLAVTTGHDLRLGAGGNIHMVIQPNGNIGIGLSNPGAPLHVANNMVVGPFAATTGDGGIDVTGPLAEFGFVRRNLNAWPATPAAGDRFVWYNPDGSARLSTDSIGDLLTVASNGNVRLLQGDLELPKTADGFASFTNRVFFEENQFTPNNLKLSMATVPLGSPPPYQFILGHIQQNIIVQPIFVRRFSVDNTGRGFFANGIGCHIIDYFLNDVGDTLEQGDVVVLNRKEATHYYGWNNNIPIPEVDLTNQAYDHRVCGIVADFVPAHDLPTVDPKPDATAEELAVHPLRAFGGPSEGQPHTEVKDRQMGRMVTLGAWAHCKADADIAPIQTGDLLTTSPTRGHVQKVFDPAKAVGAIIGKALGPLAQGKGKIPVLVTLQ